MWCIMEHWVRYVRSGYEHLYYLPDLPTVCTLVQQIVHTMQSFCTCLPFLLYYMQFEENEIKKMLLNKTVCLLTA